MSSRNEKIILTAIGLIACSAVAAYIIFFFKEPISGDPASWGQFGDYLGGTLNPFFGLLTTVFAFLAYKNTKKQLDSTEKDVKATALQKIIDYYGKDLELLINGLIFKTHSNTVDEGASALKRYRDFMGDLVNNWKRREITHYTLDQMLEHKQSIYDAIYTEISRFRHLIEYYQTLLESTGANEETLDFFREKIRLTLPLTIISCFGCMNYINKKSSNTQDGLQEWLELINLFKYHEKH